MLDPESEQTEVDLMPIQVRRHMAGTVVQVTGCSCMDHHLACNCICMTGPYDTGLIDRLT